MSKFSQFLLGATACTLRKHLHAVNLKAALGGNKGQGLQGLHVGTRHVKMIQALYQALQISASLGTCI